VVWQVELFGTLPCRQQLELFGTLPCRQQLTYAVWQVELFGTLPCRQQLELFGTLPCRQQLTYVVWQVGLLVQPFPKVHQVLLYHLRVLLDLLAHALQLVRRWSLQCHGVATCTHTQTHSDCRPSHHVEQLLLSFILSFGPTVKAPNLTDFHQTLHSRRVLNFDTGWIYRTARVTLPKCLNTFWKNLAKISYDQNVLHNASLPSPVVGPTTLNHQNTKTCSLYIYPSRCHT
jgi:hypothetical protein